MGIDKNTAIIQSEDELFTRVSVLIEESRKNIVKAVNTAMVYTYYGVGQYIVEYEQEGKQRAEYGKGVLKRLSERLTDKYGKGWSVDTLEKTRRLYIQPVGGIKYLYRRLSFGYGKEVLGIWYKGFK